MAEYIEREALREAFIKHFDAFYDDGRLVFSDNLCTAEDCEDILKLVAELPTADVVSVVRCCKCKYGNKHKDCNGNEYYGCDLNIDIGEVREVEPTHYCGYGERRCEE